MKKYLIFILGLLCEAGRADSALYANEIHDAVIDNTVQTAGDEDYTDVEGYGEMTEEQLERILRAYERYLAHKREGGRKKVHSGKTLSFYQGESHALDIDNLFEILDEVGLSNKLYVLAQAILETGNFSSSVCNTYNNVFGLYDSKRHEYYKFERWEDSVVAYKKFIQYRYKGGNYLEFLKNIGYAEDPSYIFKVAKIANQLYQERFKCLFDKSSKQNPDKHK